MSEWICVHLIVLYRIVEWVIRSYGAVHEVSNANTGQSANTWSVSTTFTSTSLTLLPSIKYSIIIPSLPPPYTSKMHSSLQTPISTSNDTIFSKMPWRKIKFSIAYSFLLVILCSLRILWKCSVTALWVPYDDTDSHEICVSETFETAKKYFAGAGIKRWVEKQ